MPSGDVVPILLAIFSVIQSGIAVSTIGLVSHALTRWLSQHTRIDEPDPTLFTRQFGIFFNTLFAPIGWALADRTRSPAVSQLSFQLGIGVAVILVALATYLITAGILTGAVLATYHAYGFVINPLPWFRTIIAFVVISALAVMIHAGDRARQLPS